MSRVGLNEAAFREVNERLNALNETFAPMTDNVSLVCECANGSCAERIDMTPARYEELRANPDHFAIVPGHEAPEVERVIERQAGFEIVQKVRGEAAQLAVETDPRAGST